MLMKCLLLLVVTAWTPICAAQDYAIEFTRNPVTYRVWQDDDITLEQNVADTAHTALYFITSEGAQYLDRPLRFEATDTSLTAEFATTDARRAYLKIEPADHGGFLLALTFSTQEGVLAVGEMLRAYPKEQFRGLTKGVMGRSDTRTRDTTDSASTDRRGLFLEMNPNDKNSRSMPFFMSSRGYGVFVEGKWTGYFDMASRIGDRIQFELDSPALSYHVFLGDTRAQIVRNYKEVARCGARP